MTFTGCEQSIIETEEKAFSGNVVTERISETVPFETVQQMPAGETLYLHINRTGTTVEQCEVELYGTMVESGERLIVAKVKGSDVTVGNGDSGSPLVTKEGKVVGALCYGFPGDRVLFIARAIDDLNNLKGTDSRANTAFEPLGLSSYISGISKSDYEKFSQRKGSRSVVNSDDITFVDLETSQISSRTAVPALIGGMSIEVSEVRGDVLNFGSVGTISSVSEDAIRAFGHSYENGGENTGRKPVYLSSMLSMVNSYSKTFKLSSSTNTYVGALVNDAVEGIVISPSIVAETIPVTLKLTLLPDDKSLNTALDSNVYTHNVSQSKGYHDLYGYITFASTLDFFNGEFPLLLHNSKVTVGLGDTTISEVFTNERCYYSDAGVLNPDDPFDFSFRLLDAIDQVLYVNGKTYNDISSVAIESSLRETEEFCSYDEYPYE